MKILQVSIGSVSTILIVVLMVSSASAAPLLSVGSYANYQLSASLKYSQSCSGQPASYNQTACGPAQQRQLVNIYDNGTCVSINTCYYSPNGAYYSYPLSLGTTVMWFNFGTAIHTATLCPTATCPSDMGLQPFDSGPLAHFGSFSVTFNTPGNYTYYDTFHPLLRGNFIISSTIAVVSSLPRPTISLDGSVGWTANAIDNNVAVLNVSHQVSIVASLGPASFTPVTETGSFSQSIDLSTRVESPGTALSIVSDIIRRMLAYYPGYYGYGYTPGLGQLLSSQKEVHTFWWVNGPLINGQPVQILTGYSGVTGSETVALGPGNNRNAWIVESTLSQSLSTTSPPVITYGGSTDSSFKLDLRFDYDQASDLLLKSSAVVSLTSAQSQGYRPGDYLCGPSGCFPVSDPVTVNHHMSASVPITLQLTTTNLDLSKRAPQDSTGNGHPSSGGTGGTSGTSTLPPASLLIYVSIGIVGAGTGVTVTWLVRRRARMRPTPGQPGSLPDPSPPLAST